MMNTIKSEARKLWSVRSTYVIMFITLLLIAFTAFYLEGYWGQTGSPASMLEPTAVKEIVGNSAGVAAMLISILAVLQVGHEYRHNTIAYTLTANARRTQVFLSKIIVLGAFSIVFGLIAAAFGVACYYVGLSFRDAVLPAQELDVMLQLLQLCIYFFVYGMIGVLLTFLVRNLIGAIVALMIIPTTVEPLLGLLLKDNAVYLPFTTFDHILGVAAFPGNMSTGTASVLSLLYIAGFGLLTWALFIRRDAN